MNTVWFICQWWEEIVVATTRAIDRLRIAEEKVSPRRRGSKRNWEAVEAKLRGRSTIVGILCYDSVVHVRAVVDVKINWLRPALSAILRSRRKKPHDVSFFLVSNVNRGKPVWRMDQVESRHHFLIIFCLSTFPCLKNCCVSVLDKYL